jgi:hypothetical protein
MSGARSRPCSSISTRWTVLRLSTLDARQDASAVDRRSMRASVAGAKTSPAKIPTTTTSSLPNARRTPS